jgi:hypothetical protein
MRPILIAGMFAVVTVQAANVIDQPILVNPPVDEGSSNPIIVKPPTNERIGNVISQPVLVSPPIDEESWRPTAVNPPVTGSGPETRQRQSENRE